VRSVLLLGIVVPVVGLLGLAAVAVGERQERRDASSQLRDVTDELRQAVAFRAAVAREEVHATVFGLASDVGVDRSTLVDVSGEELLRDVDVVRAQVDEGRARFAAPQVGDALRGLDGLRVALDRGEAGRDDVVATFAPLNDALAARWSEQMATIENAADLGSLDAGMRQRLRTLRESVIAFHQGAPRINATLAILLDEPAPAALAELAAADARFEQAVAQAAPAAGSRAAGAWRAFRSDPSAQRTEQTIDVAREVAIGTRPPWSEANLGLVVDGLRDGERWGMRLIQVVEAAAGDLAESADDLAEEAGDAVRDEIVRAAGLVLLSAVVALLAARSLVRPAGDLEAAARQVQGGEFDLPPVAPRGARELAATVNAFNDMAATLAAVEDHAVALAEDPTTAVLADPLPGRTGQAMQAAIDRLRQSVETAEEHRAELFHLATHDTLTGLLNRAAAYDQIDRALARARRDDRSLLAVYVDLDGLKELNDTYGHRAGDEAILRTADALRSTTREADVVARLGGDEFLVVGPVPPGGPEAVLAFAERIHDAVRHQSVPVGDDERTALRCSVGVVLSSPVGDTSEALIRAADAAMYRAKEAGRDRVVEQLA